MRRFISIASFLCLLLSLQAQEVYTTKNIPKVHLQDKTRYVCNPAGILSTEACDNIDRMLYALEQQTGIETVVAVVPSIGQEDCFDFSHQLLNEWGVGKKEKNNGLVILLVTDQRCIQFYTGYGLEGDLPDAICKRIQTKYMIPYLKDGNWDAGMVAGVKAVCSRLDGTMVNDTEEEDDLSVGAQTFHFPFCIRFGSGVLSGRSTTKRDAGSIRSIIDQRENRRLRFELKFTTYRHLRTFEQDTRRNPYLTRFQGRLNQNRRSSPFYGNRICQYSWTT